MNQKKIVIIQTAFLGDVILTLPLAQALKKLLPSAIVDMVVIPRTAKLLENHPDISTIISYDKKGGEKSLNGFFRIVRKLKLARYDIAFIPHRSLRSAALASLAGIPDRIGFDRSAGAFLLNHVVNYQPAVHEVERNLSLLEAIGVHWGYKELPNIYPSDGDREIVSEFLLVHRFSDYEQLVAVAPGSVWNTKRWLKERFVELTRFLVTSHFRVVLIGGEEDNLLCEEIASAVSSINVLNTTGRLSLLQSAELLRRCSVLISNDSASMHLAVAMRTPVVAIFGATVPEFGFYPYGEHDIVVETKGLWCRPCSIHGGKRCPIRTFDCMVNISSQMVYSKVEEILTAVGKH